jgi:hypothetical protein
MEYIGIEDLVLERKIYVGAYNVACTFIKTEDSFCMDFVPFCSLLARGFLFLLFNHFY